MHDSRSYRDNAAQCLLAAQEACQPYYRKLRLSMAVSWLSLARQDEAMDDLLRAGTCPRPLKAPETRALRGRVRKPPIAPTMRLRGPFD
jgi:hypothetical protein